MNNLIKRNVSLRKGFVSVTVLLVSINIIVMFGYYHLFTNEVLNDKYSELTKEMEDELEEITEKMGKVGNVSEYLESVSEGNNTSINLYNMNNELIDSYGKKETYDLSVSKMVKYRDENYLVSLSKRRNVFNLKLVFNFLVFELINILVLTLLGIVISNHKLLEPITLLSKDINNYKLGIIPKKRHINGEIDALQNDFVYLVNDLEEEKKKQNRIIASISHDIKTPLTSILGYAERVVTNPNLSQEIKSKYTNTIYNKALNLKEIVEEFDDYLSCNIKNDSKIEKISIKYIVDYLKQYYKDDLKEKGIELKVKTNCPNSIIEVDLAKFKRVFSNIITNSIRYYDKKKKILNIYINIQKDDTIIFEVADNGMGCSEDLDKIFEPLYTTDKSRKISGLGLSICKEIVESHKGTIKAINNKLGGFSVIFTISEYKES